MFTRLMSEQEKLSSGSHHVVHYTSGENALNIIDGEEFWLRNARCMNDFLEVDHGISLLIKIMTQENGSTRRKRLESIVDRVAPGAARSAIEAFDGWSDTVLNSTFIGCLSSIPAEDNMGKLSMWRAYCPRDAGVALVMNPAPFLAETNELNAYSVPVSYLSDAAFASEIDQMLDQLDSMLPEGVEVPNIENIDLKNEILWLFLLFSLGLKHPGFSEEEEWRIFYIPDMFPSPVIKQGVATIGGIPQVVQKIPLIDDPAKGLVDASLPKLLNRIIIGPTEYPRVVRDALASALRSKGIEKPEEKIFFSNIPLR
jgi:hypothetical protein